MRLFPSTSVFYALVIMTLALVPPTHAASNMSYGITVGTALPKEAVSVRVGKAAYLVYHGSFYRKVKNGYVLVPAPRGATIRQLPRGAQKFVIGKTSYFRHAGVVFKAAGGKFQVCEAPEGTPAVAAASTEAEAAILPVQLGSDEYVFRQGRFFHRSEYGLIGRSTPIGAVAQAFPPDGMSVWYRDTEYFESHGVFFQEMAGGFKVIAPPWQKPLVLTDNAPTLAAEH